MAGFLGRYLHQIDAKGRISLPASFRRGHETEPFILVCTQPNSLALYPDDSWNDVQNELRDLVRRNPDYGPMLLTVTANANEVSLDKQGRILIPDRLRQGVGLGSEALIVGAINRIEIWEPERFEASTSVADEVFDKHVRTIFS